MKIDTLTIRNFKGIVDKTFNFDGVSTTVYGINASGKTTLPDASNWLWTGKDSLGQADFTIKPLQTNGEARHGLDSSVEMSLDLEDERTLSLRKVFKEQWTKRRGSAQKEFTGHITDHFVDGVPVKKAEYQAVIGQIASEEIFRLLTSPLYFSSVLQWQKRRALLIEICGDIPEEEILKSDKSLEGLKESIWTTVGNKENIGPSGLSPFESARRILQGRRTEINRELEKIPVRIDEVSRSRPDISLLDDDAFLDLALGKSSGYIEKLQTDKATLQAGGGVAEKKLELAQVNTQMAVYENDYAEAVGIITKEKRNEQDIIEASHLVFLRGIYDLKIVRDDLQESIKSKQQKLDGFRIQFEAVNEAASDTIVSCELCGQKIPASLQEASKSKLLVEINRQGKELKGKLEKDQQALLFTEKDIASREKQTPEKANKVAALKEEISRILDAGPSEERFNLSTKKAEIQKALDFLAKGNTEAVADVEQKIEVAQAEQDGFRDRIAQLDQAAATEKRINELEAEEKKLAADFEETERQLFLLDTFTKKKVALLEEKINSRFKLARFKLFEEQINGGIQDCCEVTYGGVPYNRNLNGAARVQVGCDIIRTLSKYFFPGGETLPLFIDERQSVTELPEMDCQVISLQVSNDVEVEIKFPDLLGWGMQGERVWMPPDRAKLLESHEAIRIIPKDKNDKTLRVELEKEELAHAKQ